MSIIRAVEASFASHANRIMTEGRPSVQVKMTQGPFGGWRIKVLAKCWMITLFYGLNEQGQLVAVRGGVHEYSRNAGERAAARKFLERHGYASTCIITGKFEDIHWMQGEDSHWWEMQGGEPVLRGEDGATFVTVPQLVDEARVFQLRPRW